MRKAKASARKPKSVTIYVAKWCPWCRTTTDFLRKNKIKFKSCSVDVEKYASESIRKSGQAGIPVIEIGESIVVGFDESKLKEMLNIR